MESGTCKAHDWLRSGSADGVCATCDLGLYDKMRRLDLMSDRLFLL